MAKGNKMLRIEDFKEYKSKQTTRKAYKIPEGKRIDYYPASSLAVCMGIEFNCHQTPRTGDYIIYIDNSDIYHCSKKVFEERNIV